MNLATEAAEIEQELDDPVLRCFVRGNQGLTALLLGRHADALLALEQELVLARELGLKLNAAEALMGLAALAANDHELDRAATLWGAAQAHDPTCEAIVPRLEEHFFGPARTAAGDDRSNQAYRDGQRMPLHDAIALGRRTPAPASSGAA
jgi:hypothetical protein